MIAVNINFGDDAFDYESKTIVSSMFFQTYKICFLFAINMSKLMTYVTIQKCLISQAIIGISENTILLLFHVFTFLLGHRPKLTDMTTGHLAFIHIVVLLSKAFLVSPDLFESLNFPNDFKCKAFFYLSRVMRGLSICTTCQLSMLQAITVSPSSSWLARFKHKSTRFSFHFFFWSINLTFNCNQLFFPVASSNMTQNNLLILSKFCSFCPYNSIIRVLIPTFTVFVDIFFVGIMVLSSAYMVVLLCRHQRWSQQLHSTQLSIRTSPEKRATQTILLLVSFFVVIYGVDFSISFSSSQLRVYDPVVLDFQRLVVHVYATVSPLVLISSDKRIIKILQYMIGKHPQFLSNY